MANHTRPDKHLLRILSLPSISPTYDTREQFLDPARRAMQCWSVVLPVSHLFLNGSLTLWGVCPIQRRKLALPSYAPRY